MGRKKKIKYSLKTHFKVLWKQMLLRATMAVLLVIGWLFTESEWSSPVLPSDWPPIAYFFTKFGTLIILYALGEVVGFFVHKLSNVPFYNFMDLENEMLSRNIVVTYNDLDTCERNMRADDECHILINSLREYDIPNVADIAKNILNGGKYFYYVPLGFSNNNEALLNDIKVFIKELIDYFMAQKCQKIGEVLKNISFFNVGDIDKICFNFTLFLFKKNENFQNTLYWFQPMFNRKTDPQDELRILPEQVLKTVGEFIDETHKEEVLCRLVQLVENGQIIVSVSANDDDKIALIQKAKHAYKALVKSRKQHRSIQIGTADFYKTTELGESDLKDSLLFS